MNIYEKLSAIQNELKAPKNQRNDFGDYNYRSCEDILESVKPICAKHKTVTVISDDVQIVGGRYYIKSTAKLIDIESSEQIETTAFAREEETKKKLDSSQITGSASSYARKYALNGLFCIDDTKDADAVNTHGKEKPLIATPEQKKILVKYLSEEQQMKLMDKYNIDDIGLLDRKTASDIISKMRKK